MRVLSFDCANRSLAVCYLTLMDNYEEKLKSALDKKDSDECIRLINNYVTIHILKIVDVTKTKTVPDTVRRASLLKRALADIDNEISKMGERPDAVLIEYQMSLNDKSRCVSQQIAMYYVDEHTAAPNYVDRVYFVGPTLKNKVCFKHDLDHGHFMEKHSSKYTANKNHAKENLKYWLTVHNQLHFLKNVPKKNHDDLADAFMQIFGWLYYGR